MSADNATAGHAQVDNGSTGEREIVSLDNSGTWIARLKNNVNAGFERLSEDDHARWVQAEEMRVWPKMLHKCQKRRAYLMKYSNST